MRMQYWHPSSIFLAKSREILIKVRKQIRKCYHSKWKPLSSIVVLSTWTICFTTLSEFSRSKSKKTCGNQCFPEKISSFKVLVWKGKSQLWQSFRELFGRKRRKFFAQVRQKWLFALLKLNTYTSKCSPGDIDYTIDNPWEKFGQNLEKVSLKAR